VGRREVAGSGKAGQHKDGAAAAAPGAVQVLPALTGPVGTVVMTAGNRPRGHYSAVGVVGIGQLARAQGRPEQSGRLELDRMVAAWVLGVLPVARRRAAAWRLAAGTARAGATEPVMKPVTEQPALPRTD
jgi:hypothetical protein